MPLNRMGSEAFFYILLCARQKAPPFGTVRSVLFSFLTIL